MTKSEDSLVGAALVEVSAIQFDGPADSVGGVAMVELTWVELDDSPASASLGSATQNFC